MVAHRDQITCFRVPRRTTSTSCVNDRPSSENSIIYFRKLPKKLEPMLSDSYCGLPHCPLPQQMPGRNINIFIGRAMSCPPRAARML